MSMMTWKDALAFLVALGMVALSHSLAAGIFMGLAVWVCLDSHKGRHYKPNANRRYLMRESQRRRRI